MMPLLSQLDHNNNNNNTKETNKSKQQQNFHAQDAGQDAVIYLTGPKQQHKTNKQNNKEQIKTTNNQTFMLRTLAKMPFLS